MNKHGSVYVYLVQIKQMQVNTVYVLTYILSLLTLLLVY